MIHTLFRMERLGTLASRGWVRATGVVVEVPEDSTRVPAILSRRPLRLIIPGIPILRVLGSSRHAAAPRPQVASQAASHTRAFTCSMTTAWKRHVEQLALAYRCQCQGRVNSVSDPRWPVSDI